MAGARCDRLATTWGTPPSRRQFVGGLLASAFRVEDASPSGAACATDADCPRGQECFACSGMPPNFQFGCYPLCGA